ncbi:DNA primase family protein [Limosilactobacillus mucosae]|uniref:DNA primase family protein n=1 Tax=Limosilactobacillus mucosae TaxID=97478 RepID=UPI001F57C854|nr:DNA primase family protein [Limosilactobacillus mucosae]UNL61136.1 DNA primase [Limosilactobacillus mucosae]
MSDKKMKQIDADLVEIDQDAENAKYEEQHKAKQPIINEPKLPADMIANIEKLKALQEKPKPITSMAELFQSLKTIGYNWREENKEEKRKKDGTVKTIIHRVPVRTATNFLKEQVVFATIGENSRDLDKAPLTYYDLDKGIYIKSERQIERMINAIDDQISKRGRNEVIGWLTLESKQARPEKNPYLVPVGNGVVDTKNNKLLPFSPNFIFTSKVATNYNPDAAEPNFNGWTFSHWVDEIANGNREKTTLIWQMIASVVQNRRTSNVFFALVDDGKGGTGKSTFEQLLMNLVGEDNYASLKMVEFDQQFLLAQAYGATLIIGDDNEPKGFIEDGSTLKSVVTNEPVLINPKGLTPFTARFYCTIVQSMNGIPRFKDTSSGLYRRFRMIKFNHHYDETKENKRIKHEYVANPRLLEWILKTALTVNIDEIIDTEESMTIVHETKLDNDPVLYFYENYIPELKSTRIPVKFLFSYFMSAMDAENNHQQMKQNTFTKQIKILFERDGWAYSLKNLAPLEYFNEEDRNLIIDSNKATGTSYGYLADIDRNKTQPLFFKTTDKPTK